jgi:hypothetical protein
MRGVVGWVERWVERVGGLGDGGGIGVWGPSMFDDKVKDGRS